MEDIKIGADKGDAEAQYLLGVAYLNGWEVEQNPSAAVKWLYKSAQKGNANAQVQIGELLEKGEILPLNIDEAVSSGIEKRRIKTTCTHNKCSA